MNKYRVGQKLLTLESTAGKKTGISEHTDNGCTDLSAYDCKISQWSDSVIIVMAHLRLSNFCHSTSFDLSYNFCQCNVDSNSTDIGWLFWLNAVIRTKICDKSLVGLDRRSWMILIVPLHRVDVKHHSTSIFWHNIFILSSMFYPVLDCVKGWYNDVTCHINVNVTGCVTWSLNFCCATQSDEVKWQKLDGRINVDASLRRCVVCKLELNFWTMLTNDSTYSLYEGIMKQNCLHECTYYFYRNFRMLSP